MPNSPSLTLVVSAGQSRNPEKRKLESELAEQASQLPGVTVLRIPHLYDLARDSQTFTTLREIAGDMVVVCWLFDRATHWILDRNGVRGQPGTVELLGENDDDPTDAVEEEEVERVTDAQPRPTRQIFCIEFRASENPADFVAEVRRIQASLMPEIHSEQVTASQLERFTTPANDTFVGSSKAATAQPQLVGVSGVTTIDEPSGRRWYPVIDFSRCTNCMECIDFCLFGVYGVDSIETIVVEQPDNCRKGCPACSRVCPQNAIIFPQHKSPAIAGAPVEAGGLKIDLSKLFGAPDSDEDAAAVAARERDEQLILAGRAPVGGGNELAQRLAKNQETSTNDDLDSLIDELDALDL